MREGVSVIVPTANREEQSEMFAWQEESKPENRGNEYSPEGKYITRVVDVEGIRAEVGIGRSRCYIYFKDEAERTVLDRDWLDGIRSRVEQVAKGLSVGGESNSNLLSRLQDDLSMREMGYKEAKKLVERQKQAIGELKGQIEGLKEEIKLRDMEIEELKKREQKEEKLETAKKEEEKEKEIEEVNPTEETTEVLFNLPYGGICEKCVHWHSSRCGKPTNSAKMKSQCYTIMVSPAEKRGLEAALRASADGMIRMVEGRRPGCTETLIDDQGDRIVTTYTDDGKVVGNPITNQEEGEW